MQNTVQASSVSSAAYAAYAAMSAAPELANFSAQGAEPVCADHQFVALLDTYRNRGGLARAQEVLTLVRRCHPNCLLTLASWIVKQKVICFEWQSKTWLPLFQFDNFDMLPQPGLEQVLAELRPGYATWESAQWFVQVNPWLAGRTPADALLSDLPAVLHAARSDPRVVGHLDIGGRHYRHNVQSNVLQS